MPGSFGMWRHVAAWSLGAAALATSLAAGAAYGGLADVEVVDRTDGVTLPVYVKDGQRWVVGTPGHEYLLRIRSREPGRVLAVTSVDGVNAVTGETASPAQSGYVLDARGSVEIAGWRKSLQRTAAFYFTDLGDAYATRTGRPDNVGIIGVALFRERRTRVAEDLPAAPMASDRVLPKALQGAEVASAPAPSLGTGHGRSETSYAERVAFERATTDPAQVITIRYDRRENLAAMGVLPVPGVGARPNAFPEARSGFVPDPPR